VERLGPEEGLSELHIQQHKSLLTRAMYDNEGCELPSSARLDFGSKFLSKTL